MSPDNAMKLVAVVALLEYTAIRPFIMDTRIDHSNFIGFCLVHALLAYFGRINLMGLDARRCEKPYKYGLAGGLLGYAWMLLYIKYNDRQIHHLFIANAMILAGIFYGSYTERQRLPRSQRTPGGGGNPRRAVREGFLDPTARMMPCGPCGSC